MLDYPFADRFSTDSTIVFALGDSLESMRSCPDDSIKLVITSPPYNIGKEYEQSVNIEHYLENLKPFLKEIVRILTPNGSICWQVGNYVKNGEVFPLDAYFYPLFKALGLQLRNRIVWTFEHGMHCKNRFSGRYETLLWFTKSENYTFNLDSVRVPSKYPGKRHFKPGPKYGTLSGNPLGKNPGDIWKMMEDEWVSGVWNIPNVKANHPEKTIHPCQYPIELAERCILALTNVGDWVLDPFNGAGSSVLAAVKQGRRAMGCERDEAYMCEAKRRMNLLLDGKLPYRPLGKPVYTPSGKQSQKPTEWQ